MHHLTRRALLAGATASAATVLAPISGIHRLVAKADCLRSLKEFLQEARQNQLTSGQRKLIVEQGITLLDEFYCHLPQKRQLYGARPVERLRDLREVAGGLNDDLRFHARMMAIFTELRDQHTRYKPPRPYLSAHAFLPFRIEACIENDRRKYIVSRIVPGFTHQTFRPGVEVIRWNGTPIEGAADRAGGDGATPSARGCIGLARLTQRVLQLHPVPEEESVQIRYRADDGQELDIEIAWQVISLPDSCNSNCDEMQQMGDFRKFLFAKYDVCSAPIDSKFHTTPGGDVFGYIRLYSFENVSPLDGDKWVDEFKKHMAKYSNTKGLIVDVRDNAGGSIRTSERILQWVAPPGPIAPSTLYFRATNTTLRFCNLPTSVSELGPPPEGLHKWSESIKRALDTGATFSDAFEYTTKAQCNSDDRIVFPRPVIVVANGMTWSAGEFFAAGFQDHGGTILGVDETTGGGGANYRQMSQLSKYFTDDHQASPFEPLANMANGADFLVAFRRNKRVGRGAGKEIEDAGVVRNRAYAMTRNDVLHDNQDLKNHAARLLAQMP